MSPLERPLEHILAVLLGIASGLALIGWREARQARRIAELRAVVAYWVGHAAGTKAAGAVFLAAVKAQQGQGVAVDDKAVEAMETASDMVAREAEDPQVRREWA